MTQPVVNIVTLKWGDRYGPETVNRLHAACRAHLSRPFRFVCFTDDPAGVEEGGETFPIPPIDLTGRPFVTGWRKLCLFQPGLPIEGPSLFLDLDLLIMGPLDPFFDYEPDRIPIIHNWTSGMKQLRGKRPPIGNSSVFRFLPNEHTFVYEQFLREKDWALANFNPPQTYLTHCIREHMVFWPDDWTRSFKRHCRPVFPLNLILRPKKPDTRILVFHGRPDPEEVVGGYNAPKLRHRSRAAAWLDAMIAPE